MRKFYGPPIPGSISPVPATEEMTEPVGIKDGQLWTKGPDGGLEERVETLETDVGNLQETATEHGSAINNLEIDMTDAENDISGLQNRMTAAESNIGSNAQSIGQLEFDVSQAQTDIVGLGLSKLDKPTNEGETGDVIVKTANGTEYQAVAPFNPNGTYPNVTAGKAISAKSLENVSEDSGATQTAPFFFQATATANGTEETPTAPVFNLKSIRGNTIVYNQLVDGVTQTYPTISGHVYWFKHDPLVSLVTSTGTDINVPTPQSDKLVDLTRWFNGNIPQAILDAPTIFPINYYNGELTYSAGELKNCSCTELKTVGFNAWAGNSESNPQYFGHYYIGNDGSIGSSVAYNAYRIEVLPNTEYYEYLETDVTLGTKSHKRFVDENYNLISFSIAGWNANGAAFTTPNGCRYIEFAVPTEFNGRLVFNLSWDGQLNGTYKPFVSNSYQIVFSGKSAGNAYDERLPDGTEITRIKDKDIGTFSAGAVSKGNNGTNDYFLVDTSGEKKAGYYNISCAKFSVVQPTEPNGSGIASWMVSGGGSTSYLYFGVPTGTYADVSAFLTAMSGQHIYYELATPTTSEGTPYTSEIEGDDYGTMSFDSVVPVGNEFFYPADYSLLIDDLGNYTGYDVTKLMLKTDNVVPSAPTSDGTYVLKCVVSGGTPSYSWIAET